MASSRGPERATFPFHIFFFFHIKFRVGGFNVDIYMYEAEVYVFVGGQY